MIIPPVNSALRGFQTPAWYRVHEACKKDDISLMKQAISEASRSERDDLEQVYRDAVTSAIHNNATTVLKYLITKKDADVSSLIPSAATSKATLEILLDNGWDINWRPTDQSGSNSEPFMWQVVGDGDMVAWCLKNGANVFPEGVERLRRDTITVSQRGCRQILERAAMYATIPTFELLRSKGAPLGWRPLHFAVQNAAILSRHLGTEDAEGKAKYATRLEMVRHLIDTVGVDVNAPDHPVGVEYGGCLGTPICYVANLNGLENTRELTWMLLDRGADPGPGLEEAKFMEHETFAKDVEEWEAERGGLQKDGGSKCSVQ